MFESPARRAERAIYSAECVNREPLGPDARSTLLHTVDRTIREAIAFEREACAEIAERHAREPAHSEVGQSGTVIAKSIRSRYGSGP